MDSTSKTGSHSVSIQKTAGAEKPIDKNKRSYFGLFRCAISSKPDPKSLQNRVARDIPDEGYEGSASERSSIAGEGNPSFHEVYHEVDEEAEGIFEDSTKDGGDEVGGRLTFEAGPRAEDKNPKIKTAAAKAIEDILNLDLTQVENLTQKIKGFAMFGALFTNPSSYVFDKKVGLRKATYGEFFSNIFQKVTSGRRPENVAKQVLMEHANSRGITENEVDRLIKHLSEGLEQAKRGADAQKMNKPDDELSAIVKKFLK